MNQTGLPPRPMPPHFLTRTASSSATTTANTSADVSPEFYRYVDPEINDDQSFTPLTSLGATPPQEPIKSAFQGGSTKTDLESLKRRVQESCEGRNKGVEAWGHRGASATWPENTMASFRATCEAGAHGIETDIHVTSDNVLVMFHDPELAGKTTGSGKIHETPWEGVLEHMRTKAQPPQPLPRFSEVLELLMEPANIHVKLNIDCKVENKPEQLFPMIKEEMLKYENWEALLAPRIILGIWHPKFISPAKRILPFLNLYAICMSVQTVRTFFFDHCVGFSICFPALYSAEGKRFREEAARAGKRVTVWTVNDRSEMLECIRWGVRAVITDVPRTMVGLQEQIEEDPTTLLTPFFERMIMPWSSPRYYAFKYNALADEEMEYLEREGGEFYQVQDVIAL